MFVSESTLNFMGTKLQVMSAEGHIWEGQHDPSATIDTLKRLAFQHFYPSDTLSSPDHFRVVYPSEGRTLGDNHAIHEERLKENDVLLFIRRRAATPPDEVRDMDLKPPTAAEILAATKDLPIPPKPEAKVPTTSHPSGPGGTHGHSHQEDSASESNVDFQLELRKIIISLVSVMSTLLHENSDANLICQQMHTRLKRRLAVSQKPIEGSTFQYPPPPSVDCSPMGIVSGMAEARKREFRPNSKAMEGLREMGFSDEQIIEALRVTKNSKDAACEWIIAGKKNSDDSETGLDATSHLFSALVSAPTIRLGLSNPKTLLAFLNILETPSAANVWLNDTDTAPVLSTIFKIYHAEKHAAPPEF